MAINFKSAGVSTRIINLTSPTAAVPVGIPAGVVGTSQKGPAFVPTTFASINDFVVAFGVPTNDRYQGPMAISEWLRNQQAATFMRVLGVGQGKQRETAGDNKGRVLGAGFVVGDPQPQAGGALGTNTYANVSDTLGRLYFLGCFMSESAGSSVFRDAGLVGEGLPVVRGVLMAASGVAITLSSSWYVSDNTPLEGTSADSPVGFYTGSINLNSGREEFVLLLNGHKGTDLQYPRIVTASFDVTAPNYISNVLNTDPLKLEEAGHLLYTHYPIHGALATVTGSGTVVAASGSGYFGGFEHIAFVLTGAMARNSGSATAPSFENFEDRFRTAASTWVISQKFGGQPKNLFRIHALDDGDYPNLRMKWSIENLTPSLSDAAPWGTFDLIIRRFEDTDKTKETLEAWRGLSLNPSSVNYIAKIIGDTHTFFNFDAAESAQKLITVGDYPNRSRYIRVEMASAVTDGAVDSSALPVGFRGPAHLVTSGSAPLSSLIDSTYFTRATSLSVDVIQPPVPYRQNLVLGASPNQTVDKGLYWGVQFEQKISATELNSSTAREKAIEGFVAYFPNFHTEWMDVEVEGNEGTADTAANGILDADRFNNNLFSLENIKLVYTPATDLANTQQLSSWSYVRDGEIAVDSGLGTRPFKVSDLSNSTVRAVAKFSGFFHGGFDGTRIFNTDTYNQTNLAIIEEMDNSNRGVSDGPTVKAFDKALDIMKDTTEVDVQLLTIPDIRHAIISDKALQITEERFDALYLMDIPQYDSLNTLITSSQQTHSVKYTVSQHRTRGLNSSFGAAYYPDVVMRDSLTGTTKETSATVAALGALAKNDAVGYPWWAPAGYTRGALETTEDVQLALNRSNLDDLQEANINPIVAFADSGGPLVWGQKTLLATDSALERIGVRRMLVSVRRDVKKVAHRMLFEPNREATLARFARLVDPILKNVQQKKGVNKYLIRIDASTTTQADVENNTVRGKIWLIPTRTLEFLSVDFEVTNKGSSVTSA